jgi:fatty-acyl-CoA synthase
MYHIVGGVQATGAVLVGGGSVVLRENFSARHFWTDLRRWDCTLFQYIGELCRYLLRAEPHPDEAAEHRIRLCSGNGLRGDIWDAFKTRFRIPQIQEFYGATEGQVSLFNVEGKSGAIGRVPLFLRHRFPVTLIRIDADGGPVRDSRGFCVPCGSNEAGEAIGPLDQSSTSGRFDGYTDRAASEMRILHDVFETGDAWFRTGDLMRKDEQGYFYFLDRIGDTFRWKGENVATSEVAAAICAFPGVKDAAVYGVEVPGTEGRAGMAAIVADDALDLGALARHLLNTLPHYARPVFLRVRNEIEVTTTFKHAKAALVRDAYDPTNVAESIYFKDPDCNGYVPLDRGLYEGIQAGRIRV